MASSKFVQFACIAVFMITTGFNIAALSGAEISPLPPPNPWDEAR